jgi:oligopeptide transport system substrate-binding protein
MKKILLLTAALMLGFSLAACGGGTDDPDPDPVVCDTGQHEEDGVCVDDTVECDAGYHEEAGEGVEDAPDVGAVDTEAPSITYFGGVDNMNPYSETLADSSTMYTFLTDGLYYGDYDWATAIADGLATEEGDFETSGAAALPYGRFPGMAAGEPVDVNGDGTVWEITLRDDLAFEDGTAIDANTFEYSWMQLLSPDLLNDRASNLYDPTNLPLVNAEAYFKQNSFKSDKFGFNMYDMGAGVTAARENSFSHLVTGTTWELYFVEAGPYEGMTYAAGATALEQNVYTEYWGPGYGLDGWVLVDYDDAAFDWDSEGTLIAPYAGWKYADGTDVAVAADAVGDTDYAGAFPAYYTDETVPARVTVDVDGIPVGGTPITQDAVLWADVGFEVISQYVFQIELTAGKTAWDVKGNLMSGITGVVHPANFAAGMNEAGTQTTYGTIDNQLVSYGQYVLEEWADGQVFLFTRNEDHYAASDMRIKHIRYEVIEDQSVAVDEFKAGRLDVVAASGDYYEEFKYSPNLKLSPRTTFFRFAFNIAGSKEADPVSGEKAYDINPVLTNPDFRKAFYYAIDREEFALNVRAPSHPTYGFLGPVYLSTEYSSISYRGSAAGASVLEDFFPETYGYNPAEAKRLFDLAYDAAVTAEEIAEGDIVTVEYKFYDVETNWKVANWVKSTVEAIFNEGANKPRFNLALAAVSSAALNDAWDNGDFEMTFGGWQGLQFDAPSMLGQVYNSSKAYMLEVGFDTENAEVTLELPQTKAALDAWAAEYEALTTTTDAQDAAYDEWVDMLDFFDGDTLTCTYDELYNFAYGALYNVSDVNYTGKVEEFDVITGALEGVLLDQMIAIPLFTTVAATVYSSRVVFEANEYHAWMAWGGYKYMYIQVEA